MMGTDNPLLLLATIAVAGFLGQAWWQDFRAAARENPNPQALPGATPAKSSLLLLATAGSLVLVALETFGEVAFGLSGQQSKVTVLFGVFSLAAAFVEELVFRGFLVVTRRGRTTLVLGVIAASAAFALLHPYLWQWGGNGWSLHPTRKAWFSTAAIFVGSLWFYALRFLPANPAHSLAPCIAGHLAKNAAVFGVKLAQGFVSGWW